MLYIQPCNSQGGGKKERDFRGNTVTEGSTAGWLLLRAGRTRSG